MFVNLMVGTVATKTMIIVMSLEIIIAHSFTTLNHATLTKMIVATILALVTVFVMILTITESAIMIREIAALETRIQPVALSANVSILLM